MEEFHLEKGEETDSQKLTKKQAIKKYKVGFALLDKVILKEIKGKKFWCFSNTDETLEEWDKFQKSLEEDDDDDNKDYDSFLINH